MNQMTFVVPPPPALPPPLPLSFAGDRGEFRRLVSRGAALEFVTLGFYRFWLATDIRRHLWSNTLIDGDAAEYTGRARELLIGFLFALAILVPIYLAYTLVGIEVERFKAFASVPLFLFFYLFGQFAIYRARRYRLTRTVWRGLRFWMNGSGWAYAARAALWAVLAVLTLGLALPWREAALERYKMRHSYYGDLAGSFEGRGWDFFKQGWWLWLLAAVFAFLTFGSAILSALAKVLPKAAPIASLYPYVVIIAPIVSLIAMVAAPFMYGVFKAIEWRWWVSGIRFGGVSLESAMRRGALIGLYWKVIGWFMLFAVAMGAYLWGCLALVARMDGVTLGAFFRTPALMQSVPVLVLAGIGYLVTILGLNVVMRMYLLRDLWARVMASTTVHGIEAAANVSAKGELANALGEGFADGLDVAGF